VGRIELLAGCDKTHPLNGVSTRFKMKRGILVGEDGVPRCSWAGADTLYQKYHDKEWGRPMRKDHRLFEKVCLEGFQAGLSWLTILKKRENFRKAFSGFDIDQVARYNQRSVERLLKDAGIVRHRGKIESTINNAKRAQQLKKEFGSLSKYFCQYVPPTKERPKKLTHAALMKLAKTPTSAALSKDLKDRGWTFVGPTTCYAFMQATGLVNDHIEGCAHR
jgi:DNA-3-methyladenine glycosylase I